MAVTSRLVLVALGLVALFASCSSSEPQEVSATLGGGGDSATTIGGEVSSTEPCAVLTSGQVGEVLGVEVGEGTPGSASDCSWGGSGGSVQVVVAVESGEDACAIRRVEGAPPVEGLAGEAWWEYLGEAGVGTVTVCLEGEVRVVTVTADTAAPPDEAALRGQVEALAAAAAGA
jgi:hypothetical protein